MHDIPLDWYSENEIVQRLSNISTMDDTNHLCTYCYRKIQDRKMPPTCILNNSLDVRPIPKEIAELNEFEKILIQRAKAFQVIARMDTVMGAVIRDARTLA